MKWPATMAPLLPLRLLCPIPPRQLEARRCLSRRHQGSPLASTNRPWHLLLWQSFGVVVVVVVVLLLLRMMTPPPARPCLLMVPAAASLLLLS